MKKQIMTATKIPPISLYNLRQSNLQYKNNKNNNINQLDKSAKNNNDIPPKKTTNRQHRFQTKKYGTISNSQMQSKHTQSEPTITKTTNHMVDESTASTSTKNINNNIPNEPLHLQQNKNNASTIKNFKINNNNNNKPKSSLQNNGQYIKKSPSNPVSATTAPLRSDSQQRLSHDRKSIPPTKTNPMAKNFATTKQQNLFSFFSSNTVAPRRGHVEKIHIRNPYRN